MQLPLFIDYRTNILFFPLYIIGSAGNDVRCWGAVDIFGLQRKPKSVNSYYNRSKTIKGKMNYCYALLLDCFPANKESNEVK